MIRARNHVRRAGENLPSSVLVPNAARSKIREREEGILTRPGEAIPTLGARL